LISIFSAIKSNNIRTKMDRLVCECGSSVLKYGMAKHKRSTKHVKYTNDLWLKMDLKKQEIEKLEKEISLIKETYDSACKFNPI